MKFSNYFNEKKITNTYKKDFEKGLIDLKKDISKLKEQLPKSDTTSKTYGHEEVKELMKKYSHLYYNPFNKNKIQKMIFDFSEWVRTRGKTKLAQKYKG